MVNNPYHTCDTVDGVARIEDAARCEAYATANELTFDGTTDPNHYPAGCYKNLIDSKVYFRDPSTSTNFANNVDAPRVCTCPPPPPRVFVLLTENWVHADCEAAGYTSVSSAADCELAATYLERGWIGTDSSGESSRADGCVVYTLPLPPTTDVGYYYSGGGSDCAGYYNDCVCESLPAPPPSPPSPPPPPPMHATKDKDWKGGLRVNEDVPRVVHFSAAAGMKAADVVVYVPTPTESNCDNVGAYTDGKHGGPLAIPDGGTDPTVSVQLPSGTFAACVATAPTSRRRARSLQDAFGFAATDFAFRADVTITSDPVDESTVFACICGGSPPPTPPPPSPPPPPPPPSPPPPSPPPPRRRRRRRRPHRRRPHRRPRRRRRHRHPRRHRARRRSTAAAAAVATAALTAAEPPPPRRRRRHRRPRHRPTRRRCRRRRRRRRRRRSSSTSTPTRRPSTSSSTTWTTRRSSSRAVSSARATWSSSCA